MTNFKGTREAFAAAMMDMAEERKDIVVISPDSLKAMRAVPFGEKYPDRYLECGIAEQGAVDAAAGLASAGLTPFIGTYCGFLTMRACEQMRTFVGYTNLNVKFVGVNAGLLGGEREGVTHQFYEDLGIVSSMPNYTIFTPADPAQCYHAVRLAACGNSAGSTPPASGTSANTSAAESDELLGSSSATIRLKIGTTTAPDGHYVLGLIEMQKLLEEYSGGEMTLDIYPNSALGNESDMMNSVSMGMQEMCLVSTGPIPSFATSTANWSVLDLPYLFENAEQAYEVLDGEVGQTLLDGFNGTGIKALGFWENGFRQITNNTKEIVTPSDLAGVKVRTMENPVHMATYTALGAAPTAMAWSEIFSALQQGTVDSQENPLAIIYTARVHEVQKYCSMIDLFYSPCVLMINEDLYNSWTDEQRTAFDKAAEEAKAAERGISQQMNNDFRASMEKEGITFTDVDKEVWKEAVQSVYEDPSLNIDQDLLSQILAVTGT